MENRRQALGRGLEQLFNNEAIDISKLEKSIIETTNKDDIVQVNIDELRSNPYQPRQHFDQDKLYELSESIKEFGVIEPIILKKSIKGYEIVAGERRVKASRIAGKKTIPSVIKDFSDEEMMQIALLENIQRENLSSIEEAQAYKNLIDSLGLTQEEFAKKIGKSRSYITNMLGLLSLPKNVQNLIVDKSISMGHAKVLSKLDDVEKINYLVEKIIHENINVRTLESMANNTEYLRKNPIKNRKKSNKYKYVEDVLRDKIGSMVKINNKNVVIPFSNEKDLERILEIIGIKVDIE